MLKQIKQLIHAMDVKGDREDALLKAHEIFRLGTEALDFLVAYGRGVNENETDAKAKKKILRAVILAISIFTDKAGPGLKKAFSDSDAIGLLCELSSQGFQSAAALLHRLGFSDADIMKERLLSLPVQENLSRDREISLDEAVQEIYISNSLSGSKGMRHNAYLLGSDGRYIQEIYRTGKKRFAVRVRKTR